MAERADGTIVYVVPGSPSGLPPVRPRDLLAAWDAARHHAGRGAWGTPRCFRFLAALDIALTDPDALSWAEAADARASLCTRYGLSLCLRLLALIELLTRSTQIRRLVTVASGEAELHPRLLAAASLASLDTHARFGDALLAAAEPFAAPDATCQSLPHPQEHRP